jgi:rod shape-determining protein MreB
LRASATRRASPSAKDNAEPTLTPLPKMETASSTAPRISADIESTAVAVTEPEAPLAEPTAEAIKKKIGSAFPGSEVREMEVRGRNLSEGVPRSFTISSNEILEALTDPLNNIVSAVKNALEQTPPELGADIADRGMMLTGGGALLRDLDRLLAEETGLPVLVAEDPLTCVVRGCGIALERMDRLGSIFTSE